MSSQKISCGACNIKHIKCSKECFFAPYFPPDQANKFEMVHKVYGASNVRKILSDLPATERQEAVNSLVYEADARLKDPVYGCVGSISILQHKLKQVQTRLDTAKQDLATYMGPCVLDPGFMREHVNQQPWVGPNLEQALGVHGPMNSGDAQHDQQLYEAQRQQVVEVSEEQDMLRNLKRHHHQQEQQIQNQQRAMDLLRFNQSFDGAGPSGQPTDSGFTHGYLTCPGAMSSLACGSYEGNACPIQQPQQVLLTHLQQLTQHQLMLQQHDQQSQQHHHLLHSLLPDQLLLKQQNQSSQPHPQQEHHLQQLIPHQFLPQQHNQSLQPHPHQEQHDHLQQLVPHQLLLQEQNQQPQGI